MRTRALFLTGVTLMILIASAAPVTADDVPEAFEEFEDLEDAIAAGYLLATPCIPDMGFHYVNPTDLPSLLERETIVALLYHEGDLLGIEEVIFRPLLWPDEPPEGFEPIPTPGLFGRHTFFEAPPTETQCPIPPPATPPVEPEGEIQAFDLLAKHIHDAGPFGVEFAFLDSNGVVNPSITVKEGDSVVITITNVDHLFEPHDILIQDSEGEILVRAQTTFVVPITLPDGTQVPTSATIVWNAEEAGTYSYMCEYHGLDMRGTITVEPEDDEEDDD